MQPTAVFLSGEFHGQRRLVGYSPWGHKELDMTEQLTVSQEIKLKSFCTGRNYQQNEIAIYRMGKNVCKPYL